MRYRVLTRLQHGTHQADIRTYLEGDIADLNDAHAAPLLAAGAIELFKPETVELIFNPMFEKKVEGQNHG